MADYDLKLYSPVRQNINKGGNAYDLPPFVEDITDIAQMYIRSIRFNGGYWRASFRLELPMPDLLRWFYERLGYHIEERAGGPRTWEGMIYEMTLNDGDTSRRRSLDLMYNHVRATYVDEDGEMGITTSSSEGTSVRHYGQREEIISMDTFDSTAAAARRDTFLAENAHPWTRPVSGSLTDKPDTPSLDVVACGYVFTANWRYVSSTSLDNDTGNLNTLISNIITNDCEYLTAGAIASNTTQITRTLEIDQRGWDTISDLIDIGDDNGKLYRAYVENSRYFRYNQVSTIPQYYIHKGKVTLSASPSRGQNIYRLKPGVYRDLDYPVSRSEQGSFFTDARDMIVGEVSVGARSGFSYRALVFNESEQMQAIQEYRQWQEELTTSEEEDTTKKRAANIKKWKMLGISRREFWSMSVAQRRALARKKGVRWW